MQLRSGKDYRVYEISALCLLLVVLSVQLFFSVRRESQTWDEANHIYTGYRSWTHADFGLNPEHPPLLKLLATAPLLGDILLELGQPQRARVRFEKALELAKTIEPEFQVRSIPNVEQRLQSVPAQ